MNAILRSTRMPWTARIKGSQEWLAGAAWLPVAVRGLLVARVHNPVWIIAVSVLLTGCAVLWSAVPNGLWLARDAQHLRLPAIERDADRVLPIYAVPLVLLPACILGLAFGHALAWLLLLALVATSVLAATLLPIWLALPACLFAVVAAETGFLPAPAFGTPQFLSACASAVVLLGAAAAWRWAALRRTRCAAGGRWSLPMGSLGRRARLHKLSGAASSAAWLRDKVVTGGVPRHVGPEFPARSIEFVINQTQWRPVRNATWGVAAIIALPVATAVGLRLYGTRATPGFLQQAMWFAGLMLGIANQSFVHNVEAFWRRRHADLALLALLPKLTAHHAATSSALRASSARLQRWGWGFAIVFALVFALLRAPRMFYIYLALATLCSRMLERALCAGVLAGAPLRKRTSKGLRVWTLVAAGVTAFWGIQATGAGPNARLVTGGWPALACVALWIVTWIAFAILTLRAWQKARQRPHPFLATPR